MTQIQTFQYSSFKVKCVCTNGEPWFRGKDVAWVLGYIDTKKAIANHVDDDDKCNLSDPHALHITSGTKIPTWSPGGNWRDPWTQMPKIQYTLMNQVSML